MRARLVRACERYVEWCDYMSDADWHRYGRALHPMFRLCDSRVTHAWIEHPISMIRPFTTNTLDRMEESKRPRMRKLAENVGLVVPDDWRNYFY